MSKHANTTPPRATRARTDTASDSPHTTSTPDRGRLTVEWWPIERPLPYTRNPRLTPETAIAKVAASLKEYGWRQPIVVDDSGVIVVGHTRLLAAQRLELAQVPVHVATDLSPAQIRAYRLADNRTAQETDWDHQLLPIEIGELAALDYDINMTGFDPDEVAAIMAEPTSGLSDPDEVLTPPAEPRTKVGDLWLLGEHRLLCGDATAADDVVRLLDGRRADLLATDPPYLVDYSGGSHPPTEANGGKSGKTYEKGWDAYIDAEHSVAFYRDFLKVALEHALGQTPVLYQCFAMARVEVVMAAWREVGLLAHQVLIWKKSRAVLTYSDTTGSPSLARPSVAGVSGAAKRRPLDAVVRQLLQDASTTGSARGPMPRTPGVYCSVAVLGYRWWLASISTTSEPSIQSARLFPVEFSV